MKMLSATKLRENLYAVLDQVLKTGVPAIVERKGRRIRIVPDNAPSRLERLERHDAIIGDPEELVHLDWSSSWNGEKVFP
ncbi:MAG: type II toxin-antitoxin system Phd/YefM family antitoxin [Spirochaetota bacterium]